MKIVSALFLWSAAGAALAGSVNCDTRQTMVDKLVCSSPKLMQMDAAYADAYVAARAAAPDQKAFLRDAGESLGWRQKNCTDTQCLESWFERATLAYDGQVNSLRASRSNASGAAPRAIKNAPLYGDSNPALGSCFVLRGTAAGVATWRDNSVPQDRATQNVLIALSKFGWNTSAVEAWTAFVADTYRSSITSADIEHRLANLCDRYQSLKVEIPLP
ncbi:hypothetical protein [Achromobacter marplatensis]|uniref:hypothetical protein n=1 Tax=Achromobacter marplatensis TaxID=470868 RepID=UPI003C77AFF7